MDTYRNSKLKVKDKWLSIDLNLNTKSVHCIAYIKGIGIGKGGRGAKAPPLSKRSISAPQILPTY